MLQGVSTVLRVALGFSEACMYFMYVFIEYNRRVKQHFGLNCLNLFLGTAEVFLLMMAYGVVVSMFDFHRSDRGSNPGRGGKIA